MTAAQLRTITAELKSNAGMITVYRQDSDSCAVALRTFRVDSVERFLRKKAAGRYTVEQAAEKPAG